MCEQEETEPLRGQVLGSQAGKDSPACSPWWVLWDCSSLCSIQTLQHSSDMSKKIAVPRNPQKKCEVIVSSTSPSL